MRGYFGIGVEGISKSGNLGNLVRSAHAFGASFFFTINAAINQNELNGTDTSHAGGHMPFYKYADLNTFALPQDCSLVGVELIENSVDLPRFRHPLCAAYVLGPEMGSLSPELVARCDFTVKIPMKFCINVGVAGAIVMYDRLVSLGGFPARPARPGGEPTPIGQRKRRQ
ncbi:MAG: RNA methyltransferase [Alphaproteobacteria bacterium]